MLRFILLRIRETVSRHPHKLEIFGSTPKSAILIGITMDKIFAWFLYFPLGLFWTIAGFHVFEKDILICFAFLMLAGVQFYHWDTYKDDQKTDN